MGSSPKNGSSIIYNLGLTKKAAKTTERGQSSMVQSSPQPSFTEAT